MDKDGKNLELDFIYYSGRAELPLIAEATQSDAKKVGIKVNLKNVDYNVLDGIGTRGEYDLLISNVLAEQAGDPEVFINMYWKTNVNGSNPQNGSGNSTPAYAALTEQQRHGRFGYPGLRLSSDQYDFLYDCKECRHLALRLLLGDKEHRSGGIRAAVRLPPVREAVEAGTIKLAAKPPPQPSAQRAGQS